MVYNRTGISPIFTECPFMKRNEKGVGVYMYGVMMVEGVINEEMLVEYLV